MKLSWREGSRPYSDEFEDIYYAEEDGLLESRYVFLGKNELKTRFEQSSDFCVAELGFGTGLNFLATWELWQKQRAEGAWLTYISCEKFPLSREQIETALRPWPDLQEFLRVFLPSYSSAGYSPGFHTLMFDDSRIRLLLLVGDAFSSLQNLKADVDAWYLDGFAPRKNTEMWSAELFLRMRSLSSPHATFATYTSAGHVRRNLEAAGFQVEKFKGFGRKREMLKGRIRKNGGLKPRILKNRAVVLGAGIAGCSIASSLARRGLKVDLFDENISFARKASWNPAAVTFPALSAEPTAMSLLSLAGLTYLNSFAHETGASFAPREPTGILYLHLKDEKFGKWIQFLNSHHVPESFARHISATEASIVSGISLERDAIYFPQATRIHLPLLCKYQLARGDSKLQTRWNEKITRINRTALGSWSVYGENSQLLSESDILVLANAHSLSDFELTKDIPIRKVRGQSVFIKSTPCLSKLRTCLNFENFLTPASENLHHLGSTYHRTSDSYEVDPDETTKMIAHLRSTFPWLSGEDLEVSSAWVEFRASLPGQNLLVGELPSPHQHAYVFSGFGSRGSLLAPLAAEILAAQVLEESPPFPSSFLPAFSPQRYFTDAP